MKEKSQGQQTLKLILETSVHVPFGVFLVSQRISFESAYSKKRRSVAGVPRSTHPCCHAHLTWRKGVGLDSSCVCPSNLLTVSQTIRCKGQPVM